MCIRDRLNTESLVTASRPPAGGAASTSSPSLFRTSANRLRPSIHSDRPNPGPTRSGISGWGLRARQVQVPFAHPQIDTDRQSRHSQIMVFRSSTSGPPISPSPASPSHQLQLDSESESTSFASKSQSNNESLTASRPPAGEAASTSSPSLFRTSANRLRQSIHSDRQGPSLNSSK